MAKVKSNLKTTRPTYFRQWRKHRRFTLEQVSERIGVTPGALSQLERGLVQYTQPMLEALADALNCEPADLIMRDPAREAAITLLWSRIPDAEKPRVMDVIKAFLPRETAA
jgi:transcriptional regulator with XRE-family HTH domain